MNYVIGICMFLIILLAIWRGSRTIDKPTKVSGFTGGVIMILLGIFCTLVLVICGFLFPLENKADTWILVGMLSMITLGVTILGIQQALEFKDSNNNKLHNHDKVNSQH